MDSCDIPEAIENDKFDKSLDLLQKIENDLDPSDFTLADIEGNFNAEEETPVSKLSFKGMRTERIRFEQGNIDHLVENGMVCETGEPGHYEVTKGVVDTIDEVSKGLKNWMNGSISWGDL